MTTVVMSLNLVVLRRIDVFQNCTTTWDDPSELQPQVHSSSVSFSLAMCRFSQRTSLEVPLKIRYTGKLLE